MTSRSIFATLFSIFSLLVFGQTAPGGVQGAAVWYHPEDESSTIANHTSFDLFNFESFLLSNSELFSRTSTYFFVLKPNFSSATGKHFMTLGNVDIYDDHIDYGGASKSFQFASGDPTIISINVQPRLSYARRVPVNAAIHDSALFEMAEVLLFPERLSRWEIHKVNSFLALKYSISITQNTESHLRYYHKADSTLYWSSIIDKFFDQRVIGVGKSADERFNQSQTTVSNGDFMLIALDTVKPIGENPKVFIDEDAFIVFSERLPQAVASLACPFDQSTLNPLRNWKFVLHNWSSSAEELKVRYQRPKGQLADSLFLWDGNQYWHLPVTYLDSVTVEYTIYFDMLQSEWHYFFVQRTDLNCPSFNSTIDPTTGELSIFVDPSTAENWILESSSLRTGLTISEEIDGAYAYRHLENEQYLIRVLNSHGEEVGMDVVANHRASVNRNEQQFEPQPSLILYPNPVVANKTAEIEINSLPSEQDVEIIISDSFGRILYQQPSNYYNGVKIPLSFPAVGYYQVAVRQGAVTYSIKAVVLQ